MSQVFTQYTVNVINLFNIYLLDSSIGMRSRENPRMQVLGVLSESKGSQKPSQKLHQHPGRHSRVFSTEF